MSLIGEWEQKGTFENMDAFLTAVGENHKAYLYK